MGSERQGIPESIVPRLDRLVRIPMVGMCDSLNLAVATSIILYELASP
jgi:TrmH family RNA methyltransferase